MLYNKEDLEKIIFFDCETIPKFCNLADLYTNGKIGEIERVEKLAENQKIDLQTADANFFSSLALIPELSQIICISFGQVKFERNEKNEITDKPLINLKSYSSINDEDQILNDSYKAFDNPKFILGGFNIIGFDIPLAQKHYLRLGKLPKNLNTLGKKPWDIKILDLCIDWKGTSSYMTSLSLVCDFLGVKNPKESEVTSKNIFTNLMEGNLNMVEVVVYCEHDVRSTIESCIKLSN